MNAPKIAPLTNIAALITLVGTVQGRDPAMPGMAVFHGYSGFGKTTAATVAANEFQAYQVQVKSVWTPSYLLKAILQEMGLKPVQTIPAMVDQVAAQLMISDVPLIIDDAHELARKGMIRVVKDIYESCQAPIVLVGEELLPQTLTKWENVHGRIYDWVQAEPCTFADAKLLAGIYSPDVEIDDGLLRAIVDASTGSIRRVSVNITRASDIAYRHGADRIDQGMWGSKPFYDGQPPRVRRALAAPQPSAEAPKVATIGKGRKRA